MTKKSDSKETVKKSVFANFIDSVKDKFYQPKISTKEIDELSKKIEAQEKSLKRKVPKPRKKQLIELIDEYLLRAGYEDPKPEKILKQVFQSTLGTSVIITLAVLVFSIVTRPGVGNIVVFLFGVWTGLFALVFILILIGVFVFLDYRTYKRTKEVEEVFPDFLQFASANISAGMPVDKALWFAVRPQFGILAKEIETVAKATMAGRDLRVALKTFSNSYDSKIISEAVTLLVEGINAGGELAGLLNKVALNIQEVRIMRREMSANVMTYVIFISFASVVAAPMLFGLATELLHIISGIAGMLAKSGGDMSAPGGLSLNFSKDAIKLVDFKIFSMVVLGITAFFSSAIVSVIQKGSIKGGFKFIPLFTTISVIIYLIAVQLMSFVFGGLF